MKYVRVAIILLIITLLANVVTSELFNYYKCEDDCKTDCTKGCNYKTENCEDTCKDVDDFIYKWGCVDGCFQRNRDIYAQCVQPCSQAVDSCKNACIQFYNMYLKLKHNEIYLTNEDFTEFNKVFQQGKCETECCPGYFLSNNNVCCKEGTAFDIQTQKCETPQQEVIQIMLDKTKITGAQTLKGKITCTGPCNTLAYIDIQDGFDVVLEEPKYLSENNPEVAFTITPKNIKDVKKKILITGPKQSSASFEYSLGDVKGVKLTRTSQEQIKQGDIITLKATVDGPKDIKYVYVLSSALDATFIYGDEYPITAIIPQNDNEITFQWKTPMISRKVSARQFYLDETGQLGMEMLGSGLKGLALAKLGSILTSNLNNHETLVNEALSTGVGLSISGVDAVATYTSDGFLPAGITFLGGIGDKSTLATGGIDASMKVFQAYQRATQRYNAFASDKIHEYPVPIKVTVKPNGYPAVSNQITVQVTAPEVIYVD